MTLLDNLAREFGTTRRRILNSLDQVDDHNAHTSESEDKWLAGHWLTHTFEEIPA